MGIGIALLAAAGLLALGGGSKTTTKVPTIPTPTPTPAGTPKLTGPFELDSKPEGLEVTFDGPLSLYTWLVSVQKQLNIGDDVRGDMALRNIAARVTDQPIASVKILSMGPAGQGEWDEPGTDDGILQGAAKYTVGELRSRGEAWLRQRGLL